jgi:uncharacterized protein
MDFNIFLLLSLFGVAILYSSVGHGGASGYLAVMAIFGIAPQLMKSSALILNLFVSLIAFYNFYDKKTFNWKLFIPLILCSIPMAFIGATLPLKDVLYKRLLAACIVISVLRLMTSPKQSDQLNQNQPIYLKLIIGASIGLLSGMLGIGGGILLSPVLLFLNWEKMKDIAAISALFIFVNSLSGILSLITKGFTLPQDTYQWIGAAIVGGLVGGYIGSKKYNTQTLKGILAFVLLIACYKLIFN